MFATANEHCFDERYFELFLSFDAVLDVFSYQPVILGYDIPREKFELYRKYMAQIFGKLMHCKRFTQLRVPTAANAEESGLESQDYIDRMNAAYDIDYDALQDACADKIASLHNKKQVSVHTGADCVLHFDLSGRDWHIDAGDGDLPCGEVYIAPLEQKTRGRVYYETLFIEGRGVFERVTLTIEDGIVAAADNADVSAYFATLTAAQKTVCELGIGMNPGVKSLCGYTVLDEKMIGSFHIAIGANNMFGGENKADMHVDFVGRGEICWKK